MPTAKRPTGSTGGRLPPAGRPRPLSGGTPISKAPAPRGGTPIGIPRPPAPRGKLPPKGMPRARPTPMPQVRPGRLPGNLPSGPIRQTGRMPARPAGSFGGGSAGMAQRKAYQQARSGLRQAGRTAKRGGARF